MGNSNVFCNNPTELQTQVYGMNSDQPAAIQTHANGNLFKKYFTE